MHVRALLLFLALTSCTATRAARAVGDACVGFQRAVDEFNGSLVRPTDAPPHSDPNRSPALALEMGLRAEACLQARGVAYERVANGLRVLPTAGAALTLYQRTAGTAVYSTEFFLAKPYAAAAFDKTSNTLFLPHADVWGETPSPATTHELEHAKSLAMLREGARLRHLMLKNDETVPDALSVDEVFAYAAVARTSMDEAARARSLSQAKQYVSFVARALTRPETVTWVDTRNPSGASALTDATRAPLLALVQCASERLPDIEACDAPLAP